MVWLSGAGYPDRSPWKLPVLALSTNSASPSPLPSTNPPLPSSVLPAPLSPSTSTHVCVYSICTHPVWRDLPALGGASQQVPLLTPGSGLRSSALLSPSVHGTERPTTRTRFVQLPRHSGVRCCRGRGHWRCGVCGQLPTALALRGSAMDSAEPWSGVCRCAGGNGPSQPLWK